MSKTWTHSQCYDCWESYNPDGRKPHQMKYRQRETCCFCGVTHWSGIYVRHDPAGLRFCECTDE